MVLVWSPMGLPTEKQKCLTYIGRINGQSVSGGKSGGTPKDMRLQITRRPAFHSERSISGASRLVEAGPVFQP
jgi:hypothetical protein